MDLVTECEFVLFITSIYGGMRESFSHLCYRRWVKFWDIFAVLRAGEEFTETGPGVGRESKASSVYKIKQ
jgi:hypothetical protein